MSEGLSRLDGSALSALFRDLPATIWATDQDLTLTFLQGPFLRELAVDTSQLVGRSLPDLIVDGREDHPLVQRHRVALSGHDASMRIEWGGNLYNARVTPLRDDGGDVVGCVGVYQQIGWMPDPDGTLRESDIRLRRVIDSNMIGIIFGNAEGQITEANEAFLALAGYSRDDLVADGLSWPALTPVEAHQRQMEALDEIRDTGRCAPFEVLLIRKDGSRIPVLVGGARLSASRRDGVAFVLDMSERRRQVTRLEAELACADALADASTLNDALAPLLSCLRTALGWRAVGLWVVAPDGRLEPVLRDGIDTTVSVQLGHLAARTRRAAQSRWSDKGETFAAPLRKGDVSYGALLMIGRADGMWDEDLIATCDRIAGRVAGLLSRLS